MGICGSKEKARRRRKEKKHLDRKQEIERIFTKPEKGLVCVDAYTKDIDEAHLLYRVGAMNILFMFVKFYKVGVSTFKDRLFIKVYGGGFSYKSDHSLTSFFPSNKPLDNREILDEETVVTDFIHNTAGECAENILECLKLIKPNIARLPFNELKEGLTYINWDDESDCDCECPCSC